MNERKLLICIILLVITISLCYTTVFAWENGFSTIEISSAEDIYALGRILTTDSVKSKYLPGYNLDADFARFDIPEDITLKEDKIQYLLTGHYELTSDIAVSYSLSADGSYFMGLGHSNAPFSGFFNGNGHTINLNIVDEIALNQYTGGYFGLFNVTNGAHINNLNISIKEAIVLNGTYTNAYMGSMIGNATATTLENCRLYIEHSDFGIIPMDRNTKRAYVWLGGFIGYCKDSTIKNCTATLSDARIIYQEQEDSLNTQTGIGGLIGRIVYETEPTYITDCGFFASNGHILNHTPSNGATAAGVGNANKANITGFQVSLENSTIQTTGIHVQTGSMYSVLSTGGIIGFSQAGSNNTDRIGVTGNHLKQCTLVSKNQTSADVILSSAQSGSELTAGGLVGCSFNNLVIEDSHAQIENGRICAEKTGNTDIASQYGTQVGGIVGRLEHTGQIRNCTVTGNCLIIHSKAPNNESNAGGIVGIDLGPYHKDVISIDGCSFDGSGNSEICMEVTSADEVGSKPVSVGGIAGTGTYIVANCQVTDVTIAFVAPTLSNPTYRDAIIGNYISTRGWWTYNKYFTPRTPGITNCSSDDITWSGQCGTGVRWYVDENVLRIAGRGQMDDFSSPDVTPWYKFRNQISSLEIDQNLEYIGQYAFSACQFSTAVIPKNVKSIGAYAFFCCANLQNLLIGSSVSEIGYAAFSGVSADHIGYGGTQAGFASIAIAEENPFITAHNITHWNISVFPEIINSGVKPTCTSVGLSDGTNCALCGKVLMSQQVIAAINHSFDDCVCTMCGKTVEPAAAIYQSGVRIKSYVSFESALQDYTPDQLLVLQKDTTAHTVLQSSLYLDLNGYDLDGMLTTNSYAIYGMDRTTDDFSCDNVGQFSCTDQYGADIVPISHFKSDISGSVRRYMSVKTEDGYSFHRFYLGITHINLRPSTTGLGYKAVFYGDDLVKSQLSETQAFGYSLQLGSYAPRVVYQNRSSFVSGKTVTLRIDNFEIERYGQTPLYAKVILTLSDGTVIESAQITATMRTTLETINHNYTALTPEQLSAIQKMIQQFAIIKSWNTEKLYSVQ